MIVDGYSHCGILKYQPVEVVLDTMAQASVDRAVLCQHLGPLPACGEREGTRDTTRDPGFRWRCTLGYKYFAPNGAL